MSFSSINPYVQEWLQTLSLKSFLCQHAQKGLLNLVCGFESIKMQGGGHICVPVIGPSFFLSSFSSVLVLFCEGEPWFSCWYFDSGMDRKQLLSFHFKNLCCLKWLQQQGNSILWKSLSLSELLLWISRGKNTTEINLEYFRQPWLMKLHSLSFSVHSLNFHSFGDTI